MSGRLDLNKVYSSYSDRMNRVVCNIHDFGTITPTLAKVVVNFNTTNRTAEESRVAIAAAFDNQCVAVEGSFRSLKTNPMAALGFVRANQEVREYSPEEAAKYKTMSSNLLMDNDDQSLWTVKATPNGNKYIVRQDQEDLSELLVTATVRSNHVPTLSVLASADVQVREYACYVNPRLEEVAYGYIAEDKGDTVVIGSRDQKLVVQETIDKDCIVETAFLNGKDQFKAVASPNVTSLNNKEAMLSYYKQLYSYSPEFYAKIEAIINSHAVF